MVEDCPDDYDTKDFDEQQEPHTDFEPYENSFDQEQQQEYIYDEVLFDPYDKNPGLPYGDDDHSSVAPRPESHPEIEFDSQHLSSKQGDLTQDLTFESLNKKRKRDRRLIMILGISLGCTIILLAAIIGAVVALQMSKDDKSAPASVAPAPTPDISTSTTPAPAPLAVTPTTHPSKATPSPAPVDKLPSTERPRITSPPTNRPTDPPTQAPVTQVPTQAPALPPTQQPTSVPTPEITMGFVSVTIPASP